MFTLSSAQPRLWGKLLPVSLLQSSDYSLSAQRIQSLTPEPEIYTDFVTP
jgi:hypothetical protein